MAATTAAVVGIVSGVAGTAMSFAQAAKQQQNIRSAQAAASQAMAEAEKKLSVNYFDPLSLPMQEIRNQQEAALVQGAGAIAAGQEADRGAAATAGRIQMAQNEAQAGIKAAAEKQLFELDKMSAMEDARLRDVKVGALYAATQGAKDAENDARQAQAAAIAQGVQGIANTVQSAASIVPLYLENQNSKAFTKSEAAYNKAVQSGNIPDAYKVNGVAMPYQQAAAMAFNNPNLKTMSQNDFTDAMMGYGAKRLKGIDWTQAPQMMSTQQNQQVTIPVTPNVTPVGSNVVPKNLQTQQIPGGSMNYFDFINNPFNPEPNNAYWITNE